MTLHEFSEERYKIAAAKEPSLAKLPMFMDLNAKAIESILRDLDKLREKGIL